MLEEPGFGAFSISQLLLKVFVVFTELADCSLCDVLDYLSCGWEPILGELRHDAVALMATKPESNKKQ